MAETGLFYRLPPNSALATGLVSGMKKQKARITVSVCSDTTGSDKMTPLVIIIGKFQHLRWFGKTFNSSGFVDYTYNRKIWMTEQFFIRLYG